MSIPRLYLEDAYALDLANRISDWLKEQIDTIGAERFVLGISGGLDSAVVAGLCARAVGPDRVLGMIMPSASIAQDLVEAQKVIDAFGITSLTVDVTSVADAIFDAMPDNDSLFTDVLHQPVPENLKTRLQLARANVRPRSRMIVNYYLANIAGGVVVGTGNRTEYMIGYSTKYGDAGVDLQPILNLYKYEVRAVARVIGVPQSVIDRPPSAGLWEGQTDEAEIGMTYAELDATLSAIDAGDTSEIDPELLARVEQKIRTTAHKRTSIPAFRK